jgi:hypothetical protein
MQKIFSLFFLAAISFYTNAQELTLLEGDLKVLKGITAIQTKFFYDSMLIGENNVPEPAFVQTKKEELDQKQAGRGARWEKAWIEDRKFKYEPEFRQMLTKFSKLSTMDKSPYTMLFKTSHITAGWNSGIGLIQKEALLDGEAIIVETADYSKVIARIKVTKMPGRGSIPQNDLETGAQIAQAYAMAGQELGDFIKVNLKKK